MTRDKALALLAAKANPQRHAMNPRNGSGHAQSGVKMGGICQFAIRITTDHALGLVLQATGAGSGQG